ncbi:MAG: hypothetical protein IJX84_04465 [Clostridia bacterium]|nr:hypothetical protein [Clostridia bacterium]MBQ8620595.1 hypothetical protein [Clostridia bacterium]
MDMSFFGKIKMAMERFMQGRNGVDNLGFAALWGGLIVSLLDSFLGTGLLSMLGTALYIYAIWRMMSRNVYKRAEENRKYVTSVEGFRTKVKQFFLRVKNSREYKYFKCPQCKVLIRLKRGSGEKQIHCPKCGCEFNQKA